jgi:hypothetical protein
VHDTSSHGPAATVSNPRAMAETATGKAQQRRLQSTMSSSSPFDLQPQGPRTGALDLGGEDDAAGAMYATAGGSNGPLPTVSNPRVMAATAEGKSQQRRLQATMSSSSAFVLEAGGPEAAEPVHDTSSHGPAATVSNPRAMAETATGKAQQRRLQSTMSSSSPFVLVASNTDVVPDVPSGPPVFDVPPLINQNAADESGSSLSDAEIMEDIAAAKKAHAASVKLEQALRGPSPAVRNSPVELVAHGKSAQRAMQKTMSASSPFSLEEDSSAAGGSTGAGSSGDGGRGRVGDFSDSSDSGGEDYDQSRPPPGRGGPAPTLSALQRRAFSGLDDKAMAELQQQQQQQQQYHRGASSGMALVLMQPEPEPPPAPPNMPALPTSHGKEVGVEGGSQPPPLSPPAKLGHGQEHEHDYYDQGRSAGPTKTTSVLRTASDAGFSRQGGPTRSVSFVPGSGGSPLPAAGFNTRDLAP